VKLAKVQIGVVGLGLVSSAHIKGYMSHPAAEVLAVCDLDETQARKVARQFGIPKLYTSYAEMLTDPAINTIDIMTPTYLHRPMAIAAARAGKNIHCEKPLGLTLKEGEDICDEADNHDVALAVDETYLFMATIVKARELIEAGEIGKPQQIRQRFGPWLDRPGVLDAVHGDGTNIEKWREDSRLAGGNGFPWQFDHNVHFFAMAQYLMNGSPVKTVYSVKADNSWLRGKVAAQAGGDAVDPENLYEVNTGYDFPLMTWTHEDPACLGVWMRAERLNGKYDFMTGLSATVIGDKGLIDFLGEGGGGLRWNGKPVHLVLHRRGKEPETFRFDDDGEDDIWESKVSYYSSAHAHRMHEFVDSLTSGRPSRYTGRDGLRDLRVAIASICSAREGLPVEVAEVTDERFYGDAVGKEKKR
jgi:predicted dehydrogenase